jgi:hypothetical protein
MPPFAPSPAQSPAAGPPAPPVLRAGHGRWRAAQGEEEVRIEMQKSKTKKCEDDLLHWMYLWNSLKIDWYE